MQNNYKEGAGRPLYSSAPQNLPAVAGTAFPPLPGSPLVWGAAAVLSYPLAWYYTRHVLMGSMRGPAYIVFAVLFLLGVFSQTGYLLIVTLLFGGNASAAAKCSPNGN